MICTFQETNPFGDTSFIDWCSITLLGLRKDRPTKIVDWQAEGEMVKQQYDDIYITNTRVVKVKESFSAFEFESIALDHLSLVAALKKRRIGLVIVGALMFVFFAVLLLATIGYGFYSSGVASAERTTFLVLDVIAVVLVVLGFLLGPKMVIFEADSGRRLGHKAANASEIEELLQWFGAATNGEPPGSPT